MDVSDMLMPGEEELMPFSPTNSPAPEATGASGAPHGRAASPSRSPVARPTNPHAAQRGGARGGGARGPSRGLRDDEQALFRYTTNDFIYYEISYKHFNYNNNIF